MRRLSLLIPAALGALALPAAAHAGPATISPKPVLVGSSGVAAVQVANSGGRVLTGSARLLVGGRTVASRTVRLPSGGVGVVKLRLSGSTLAKLRSQGTQKATVVATVAPRGGRRSVARRTITLRTTPAQPGGPGVPGPGAPGPGTPGPGTPGPGTPGGQPPVPVQSNSWVARMGDAGEYDDFAFTLVDGIIQLTKPALVPVSCFELGGSFNRTAASGELFDAMGPWTLGQDGATEKSGVAVNTLVGSSPRTITYKVTGTAQSAGSVVGTLGMTFYDSRLDFSSYPAKLVMVNCTGSQSFQAVPAP